METIEGSDTSIINMDWALRTHDIEDKWKVCEFTIGIQPNKNQRLKFTKIDDNFEVKDVLIRSLNSSVFEIKNNSKRWNNHLIYEE